MKRAIEIEYAREQRKMSTPEEKQIWQLIRDRKFKYLKFSRQYPIVISSTNEKRIFYIADFYCHSLRLIIEIDGQIHEKQKSYDAARDTTLITMGYHILRIKNEEVNSKKEKILSQVSIFIDQIKDTNH